MIDRSAPAIYAALLALALFGGIVGIAIAIVWLIVGAWFVARSNSRGIWADLAFAVTWPIWLIVEAR